MNGSGSTSPLSARDRLVVRAAWLYYVLDWTQEQIGAALGVSRSTVIRMLKEAKQRQLVEVRVVGSWEGFFELEAAMQTAFGLAAVRLVPSADEGEVQRAWLGQEAAALFLSHLSDRQVVGVSWGRTLSAMVSDLRVTRRYREVQVVSLLGGLQAQGHNPYDIAHRLADALGGRCWFLHAPAFVQSAEVAEVLSRDPGVEQVLRLGQRADWAIFSVGDLTEASTLVRGGHISEAQRLQLLEKGAVGDVLGHFFDGHGRLVDAADVRLAAVSLSVEALRNIPKTMLVAGGPQKVAAVLGALRGGFCRMLVTDEATARHVLEQGRA